MYVTDEFFFLLGRFDILEKSVDRSESSRFHSDAITYHVNDFSELQLHHL